MKTTQRKETIGNAFILELEYNDRVLTGIIERLTGPRSFRIWMPGVCNLVISVNRHGDWLIDAGEMVIEDLFYCIVEYLETIN